MEYRYMGFDQRDNTRAYKFDGLAKGEPTVHFVITADLALFLKHRIGIQEGPALCAHKLADGPERAAPGHHELTNDDLLAYSTARAEAEARKAEIRSRGARRRPFTRAQSS
jgi:hypothetical protein